MTPGSGTGHGLSASYYGGQSPAGTPLLTRIEPTVDFASVPTPLMPIPNADGATAGQWTGTLTPPKSGLYRFSIKAAGVAHLYLNGHLVVSANAEFASAAKGGFINDPGGPDDHLSGTGSPGQESPGVDPNQLRDRVLDRGCRTTSRLGAAAAIAALTGGQCGPSLEGGGRVRKRRLERRDGPPLARVAW